MKNSIINLILTLTFSFPASVLASECTNIDLRNEILGSPRDQGQIGWCFVHAAADLISYKIGMQVSAADLASTYFSRRRGTKADDSSLKGFREGGWIKPALRSARRNGVCLESDLPSDKIPLTSVSQFSARAINIPTVISTLTKLKANPALDLTLQFPHIGQAEISSMLSTYSVRKTWEKIVNASCEGRKISVQNINIESPFITRISRRADFKVIDEQLDRSNIVGISYFSKFLQKIDAGRDGAHVSVIVGRRLNTKTNNCEYLIRNSWGTGCQQYSKKLECEGGNIWVSKKLLKRNLRYVDYIKI